MTHAQALALFQCIRRALQMIVRHLEGLMGELKDDAQEAVVISRAEAYRVYAEALGCGVEELTDAEKGTALMAHVMEQIG